MAADNKIFTCNLIRFADESLMRPLLDVFSQCLLARTKISFFQFSFDHFGFVWQVLCLSQRIVMSTREPASTLPVF